MKRESASLSMGRRFQHAFAMTAVLLLSTVVCYASVIKLTAIHEFQQDLVNHRIVPSGLIVPASWAASILELSCGAACLWSLLRASHWMPAAAAGLAMMFAFLRRMPGWPALWARHRGVAAGFRQLWARIGQRFQCETRCWHSCWLS